MNPNGSLRHSRSVDVGLNHARRLESNITTLRGFVGDKPADLTNSEGFVFARKTTSTSARIVNTGTLTEARDRGALIEHTEQLVGRIRSNHVHLSSVPRVRRAVRTVGDTAVRARNSSEETASGGSRGQTNTHSRAKTQRGGGNGSTNTGNTAADNIAALRKSASPSA